jgi:dolichol-phosphate mannosyltransferase
MPVPDPELSIVVPALNEAENVGPLVEEIDRSVRISAGIDAELIVVDDGSTDGTDRRLMELAATRPWLRVLRRPAPQGQSAAMAAGIRAARGAYVATLDADLQNDPADLPVMLGRLKAEGADFIQGDRSANRRDTWMRRRASWVGRSARGLLLADPVRDTGCSARVLRADIARRLPLEYRGMHRFFPAYAARLGAKVIEHPVTHRPRTAGETKYGVGVVSRGLAGLMDCLAVRWMGKRLRDVSAEELNRPEVHA